MRLLLDAFWRSVAYCLHPRVIGLSVLPLIMMVVLSFGLGYFFWDSATAALREYMGSYAWFGVLAGWLGVLGLSLEVLQQWLAPLLLLALVTPLVLLLVLLLVSLLMTPAMVDLVAQRRFANLEKRHGGSFVGSALWSLWSTLVALGLLALSLPFWLIPPLVLILPPLIWGWLTYRVFAFDALAEHATAEERRTLVQRHRSALLGMGVASGYLGAAPSVLWASGALFIALAPLLVPLAIWIYTLVFAFASLWFSHYLLAALEALRAEEADRAARAARAVPPADGSRPLTGPGSGSAAAPSSSHPTGPQAPPGAAGQPSRNGSDVIDVSAREIP